MLIMPWAGIIAPTGGSAPGSQPAFQAANFNSGSGGTVDVAFPASISAGDFLVAALLSRNPETPTVDTIPSGFAALPDWSTPISSNGQGDVNWLVLWAFWKEAAGTESGTNGTFTFSGTAVGTIHAGIARFTGVYVGGDPSEGFNSGVGRDDPVTMPSLTTSIANRLGLGIAAFGNDETWGNMTGGSGPSWTVQAQNSTVSGNDSALGFFTCDLSTAGTTSGHQDAGAKNTNDWAAGVVALRPDPPGS